LVLSARLQWAAPLRRPNAVWLQKRQAEVHALHAPGPWVFVLGLIALLTLLSSLAEHRKFKRPLKSTSPAESGRGNDSGASSKPSGPALAARPGLIRSDLGLLPGRLSFLRSAACSSACVLPW
jgi:hypothetical protein